MRTKTILLGIALVWMGCEKDQIIPGHKPDPDIIFLNDTTAIPDSVYGPKPKVYDTVEPGSYFPAYPGSWWLYDTGDSIHVLDDYKLYGCRGPHFTNDTLNLPHVKSTFFVYSSKSFLVKGERTPSYYPSNCIVPAPQCAQYVPLYRHDAGTWYTNMHCSIFHGTSVSYAQTISWNTNQNFAGNSYSMVHVVNYYGTHNYDPPILYSRFFFAKDIGLIRKETLAADGSVTKSINLVNYHINN